MDNSNISFKSKIIFVSPKTYNSVCRKFSKLPECENIQYWAVNPTNFEAYWQGKEFWRGWRKNVSVGYTKGVRSCTAGVAVVRNKPAGLFWHIENTKENFTNLKELKNLLKGDNCIIVGSKSCFEYSRTIFEKFKKYAKSKNIPTTIFQDLNRGWQASLAYSGKDDTLFLCVNKVFSKEYVNSLEKLKQAFLKIKLAQTDTIEFANPIKEFLLRNFGL